VKVVDAVGAGDAFVAGLLDGLAEMDALNRDGLTKLPSRAAEVRFLLDSACRHAAATCCGQAPTRRALDPTPDEVIRQPPRMPTRPNACIR
jgi:fructokinase